LYLSIMLKAMVQKLILLLLLSPIGFSLQAQAPGKQGSPTKGVALGVFAHSHGFGFEVQATKIRDNSNLILGVSFASLKHPKELKIESAYVGQAGKDYIFDKKNYAYVLAPTLSISKPIIRKTGYNKISLSGSAGAGPILAFMKPYFIEVAIPVSGSQAYRDVDKYDETKYNFTNIIGEADYFLGMKDITLQPGVRGKLAANIDFSAGKEYIRAIELGMYADVFAKAPQLMGFTANPSVYIGGSVSVLIGNMW
jgi:hypothetical protein